MQAIADKKMIENDLRCKHGLRYGIPPKIFSSIQSCRDSMWYLDEIEVYVWRNWETEEEKTTLIFEFYDFKQKENESLDEVFENYCMLIDMLERAGINNDPHEINVTFHHSLRK